MPGRHSGDQVHKVKKTAAPLFYILLLQDDEADSRPMGFSKALFQDGVGVLACLRGYAPFTFTPLVSCNGGKSRLCVLDHHYAGTASW